MKARNHFGKHNISHTILIICIILVAGCRKSEEIIATSIAPNSDLESQLTVPVSPSPLPTDTEAPSLTPTIEEARQVGSSDDNSIAIGGNNVGNIVKDVEGDVVINDSSEEVIEAVGGIIESESALDRIYESTIDYLTIFARFNAISPDDVTFVILAQDSPPIRFDLSRNGVKLLVEGHNSFDNPLSEISKEISAESGLYFYTIDFAFLRTIAPLHPLSNLTPRNIDNSGIQLFLADNVRENLASDLETPTLFSLSATAETDGRRLNIFSHSLDSTDFRPDSFLPGRTIPERTDFVMMTWPVWKTSVEILPDSTLPSLDDISEAIDLVERDIHLASWRGLWPDSDTQRFFELEHMIPSEEDLIFHNWNISFLRMQESYQDLCQILGISAFYMPATDSLPLYATLNCDDPLGESFDFSVNNNTISLSLTEVQTISNILQQLAIFNQSWGEVEGNSVEQLVVLLPNKNQYLFLSSVAYLEHLTVNPYDPDRDYVPQLMNLIEISITDIFDLGAVTEEETLPEMIVAFHDDFQNAICNWDAEDDSATVSCYPGSRLNVEVNDTGLIVVIPENKEVFEDLFYQVEASKYLDAVNNFYGIVFGYQNKDNYYSFIVESEGGAVGVFRKENERFITLMDWKEVNEMNSTGDVNLLGVVVAGGQIIPTINGNPVTLINDPNYIDGSIGVIVGKGVDSETASFFFDNVEVYVPQP